MGKTDTQKEFQRQIKELEEQGIEFENPRKRTVIFEDRKAKRTRFGIGGTIFLLWNVFALSTWILPLFGIYPMHAFNSSNPTVDNNGYSYQMISSEVSEINAGIQGAQPNIISYIDEISGIYSLVEEVIRDIQQMVGSNRYDTRVLLDRVQEVQSYQVKMESFQAEFKELDRYFGRIIYDINEALFYVYHTKGEYSERTRSDLSTVFSRIQQTQSRIGGEVQREFNEAGVQYSIHPDGSIEYQYPRSKGFE